MHPAWSVILLTTLIGAGQGLFLALVTVHSHASVGLLRAAPGAGFFVAGSLVAVALTVAGLLASFLHLGRPERAWRSAAMWRTSWLSREVIVLPAFAAAAALYGLLHALAPPAQVAGGAPGTLVVGPALVAGIVGSVLAFALFVCTGMIYACLRFLAEWHTPLTLLNFMLLGSANGFTLAAAIASLSAPGEAGRAGGSEVAAFLAGWAIVLTILAAAGRVASLLRNARLVPRSTLQSAIGVKHPRVVQRSMGFMGGSFNTREFFHRASPAVLRLVRPAFLLLAFALPVLLLAAGRDGASSGRLYAAFVVQYVGLLAERWYFFAQARHPQNLYYQAVA